MIYTPLTQKAMLLAYDAHHGQLDKGGVPYIFHPIHLAEQMPDELTTCVALLSTPSPSSPINQTPPTTTTFAPSATTPSLPPSNVQIFYTTAMNPALPSVPSVTPKKTACARNIKKP